MTTADMERVNEIVRTKNTTLKSRLIARINSLGIKHIDSVNNPDALTELSTRLSQTHGMYNRIRIRFKKEGVYVQKGVGRGTTASQAGTTNRKAKDWFNSVVEDTADELAEELADEFAEIAVNIPLIN
jgi:hypothetical protein